jgi:spermidine/putrescine transport system substrate-binding protein
MFGIAAATLLGSTSARAEREINLFAWSEYVPQEVIDGFTKETGIKINYETYASNEEMLAKLKSGSVKYDLIQPSEYTIEQLVQEGGLEALDAAKLPNLKNILPEFRNMPHDPQQKYTVPWMAGTVGIVVNTDKVKEEITGYKDVFQEKYKGRIVAVNDNREVASWALNVLGLGCNDFSDENLEKIRPLVAAWAPLVKAWDSDSPKTALQNGDVDLGIVWSGEAAQLYQADKKFKYLLAKEGAHQFIDSLAIPKGAPHKEEAHLFMNYILRPEVSKLISESFPYTNPNGEARKLLDKEQLGNPASYPPDKVKLETFRSLSDEVIQKVDKLVSDLRSGV